jgi:hypothetical protein
VGDTEGAVVGLAGVPEVVVETGCTAVVAGDAIVEIGAGLAVVLCTGAVVAGVVVAGLEQAITPKIITNTTRYPNNALFIVTLLLSLFIISH